MTKTKTQTKTQTHRSKKRITSPMLKRRKSKLKIVCNNINYITGLDFTENDDIIKIDINGRSVCLNRSDIIKTIELTQPNEQSYVYAPGSIHNGERVFKLYIPEVFYIDEPSCLGAIYLSTAKRYKVTIEGPVRIKTNITRPNTYMLHHIESINNYF